MLARVGVATPEIFDRLAAIRAAKVAIQAAASIAVVPGITSAASPRLLEIQYNLRH
jgi:hypothetical protein